MNVLLIIEGTYPWYRGGVSEWVYQYVKNCSDLSFNILQIATDEFQGLDPSKALYPLTENIKQFLRVSPPDISNHGDFDLENWYQKNHAKWGAVIGEQEIIHVTNTGFAGWLGARLSNEVNRPLLLTEHAIYWKEVDMGAIALECGYKIPSGDLAKAQTVDAFKDFASYTYSNAHQIVTVSNSNIPYQQELGAESIEYIPNGIPRSWFLKDKKRSQDPVIAWVGRCAEMKNPLAFFEYVGAFRSLDISPVFTMLLSDANERSLEHEVREKAQKFPEVQCIWNEEAKPYFKTFDLLVITSYNESQPLVMLEALAHKALPTGFSIGDLTREYGFVFNPDSSVEEHVQQIVELWNKPDVFEEVVTQRFERVQEHHTWEQIFERYSRLIHSMTGMEAVS